MLTLGEFRQLTAHLDGDVNFYCCGANIEILFEHLTDPRPCISIDSESYIADDLDDDHNILFTTADDE